MSSSVGRQLSEFLRFWNKRENNAILLGQIHGRHVTNEPKSLKELWPDWPKHPWDFSIECPDWFNGETSSLKIDV